MKPLTLPLMTDRLTLRPLIASDAAELHPIYSLAQVAQFLPDEPWTMDVAVEKAQIRSARVGLDSPAGALNLIIEHDGAVLGDIMLWATNEQRTTAEIGWALHPQAQGQGFASEAARAMLDTGFDVYGLHRVVAQLDARNGASARLCERLGMSREALHRQNYWCKGEWTDTLVYAILATDPR